MGLEEGISPVDPIHTAAPGRARFRVRGLYHSHALKHAIERELGAYDAISRITANPLTGTVLVEFGKNLVADDIAALLEDVWRRANSASRDRNPFASNGILRNGAASSSTPKTADRNGTQTAENPSHPLAFTEAWHCRESAIVADRFGSSREGLSDQAAAERLRSHGPNRLPERPARSAYAILLDQFNSMPTALLLAAAGISIFTGGAADAIAIGGILAINAAIGFFTENQSESAIRSLKKAVQPRASVVRNGNLREIASERVVPGDVIALRPGTYVGADARLIQSEHLHVDESNLTGESLPVAKSAKTLAKVGLPVADRTNMVYMGSLVTGGQGLAMVVATGKRTELGLIQRLTGEAESPETPMERQLARVGRQLVIACTGVCGLIFGIGLLRGYALLEMLETAISLAVASVPEGLPTVAATTLAIGILKMRRQGVIIRKLDAVETLGCVQTICLDKTGTLTLNRMEVAQIYSLQRKLEFSGGVFLDAGKPFRAALDPDLRKLAEICVLCSETEITQREGQYAFTGSSTENALVHMALAAGIEPIALRAGYPAVRTVRRSEERNFMYTLHERAGGSPGGSRRPLLMAVKGSPMEVLAMCRWRQLGNQRVKLDDAARSRISGQNDEMAGAALRVLGVAYREPGTAQGNTSLESDLIWLGLVGMADPVRHGVGEAIRAFHRAGIDTVMITGDQHRTALAIGNELKLSRSGPLEVFDSAEFGDLEEFSERDISAHAQVFARVSPANKLQIVQALQRSGKVVAMTGDGVNDSPALKAADIGIAMGTSGTDAARGVADMVLENDDLQTMLVAIGEGRTIYRNIRKSLHFLLSTNFSEIIVMFAALAAGLGQPLNAMQLLWINLISDVLPGLALALEEPEPDTMTQAPRDPDEPVLKNSDFGRIARESVALSGGALAAYGYGLARYGGGAHAGTLAFTSLAAGQLLHAVSCRSTSNNVFVPGTRPPNRYLTAALAGSYGVQALTLFVPGLRQLLGLTPLGARDLLVVAAGAIAPFVINETSKPASTVAAETASSLNMRKVVLN